jgi:hypothetical protein
MMKHAFVRLTAIALLAVGAGAATAADQRSLVEIYRIAPGQHAAFLRFIALCDQANNQAGLPPRQLYVHQDGGGWDFIIIQPASVTDEQGKALDAAFKKLGIPQGGKFFVKIREFIAEHSDTFATGPTTAADWLKKLE